MKKAAENLAVRYILFTYMLYNKEEYANALCGAPHFLKKVGFSMDRLRTMPRICFILTAALTLAGAALRSVCMLTQFDEAVGYFNKGLPATLSSALYFLAVIAAIVGAILIPKGTLPDKLDTRLRLPAAFLYGAVLTAFTVAAFLFCYAERTHDALLAPILLGLPAALYFFLSGDRSGRYPDWLSLIGFLPVFWAVTAIWETYADQFTTMNSPVKVGLQMGFLGLALLQIAELRFRLGKALPRCAVAFMGIGVFLALNGSVPVLLGTGAHILDNTLHLFYALVLLCGGLYGLYTLFQYTWFPAEPEDSGTEAEPAPTETPSADTPEIPNAE